MAPLSFLDPRSPPRCIQIQMSEEATLAKPYVHLLEGRDPVQVLRETPARLAELLRPLSAERIEGKPGPNKWSIRELLCHLTDCELAWGWRLRITYGASDDQGSVHEKTGPVLQAFDQDAWSRAYEGACFTTATARSTWRALREWNLALIEGFSEEDKARPATHPELGPMNLGHILEIAAGHDLHHLAGLEKLTGSTHEG